MPIIADFASEELAEIVSAAESEFAQATFEAMQAESLIAVELAGEATEEGKKSVGGKAWETLKTWGAKIAAFFKGIWTKISGFFSKLFQRLMQSAQADEKYLQGVEDKAKASTFKSGTFTGKVYPNVISGKIPGGVQKVAKELVQAQKDAQKGFSLEKSAFGKSTGGTIGKRINALVPKKADGKAAVSSSIREYVLGGEMKETTIMDLKKALKIAREMIAVAKKIQDAGKLAKGFAADSAKDLSAFNKAVAKGDEKGARKAQKSLEEAKANAVQISTAVSALVGAIGTAKAQAMSVVRAIASGAGKAASEEAGEGGEAADENFDLFTIEGQGNQASEEFNVEGLNFGV